MPVTNNPSTSNNITTASENAMKSMESMSVSNMEFNTKMQENQFALQQSQQSQAQSAETSSAQKAVRDKVSIQ